MNMFPLVLLHPPALGAVQLPGLAGTPLESISFWWLLVVTGFVVFRVLDIWKPGPVRWAEQRFEGGLGVMADDLLAGVIGGLLLTVFCIVLAVTELS